MSEAYRRKAKSLFRQEILKDERKLWQDSRNGNINEVRRLLSFGMMDINCVRVGRYSSSTPLGEAAKAGRIEMVKLLLDNGAEVDMACGKGNGDTPLTWASWSGYKDVVKLLLKRGADPNKADKYGCTPLHHIIHSFFSFNSLKLKESVVKLLLDGGADSNKSDRHGRTPLYLAAEDGLQGVVKLLIDGGASPNNIDADGKTPLHLAAKDGHKDVVRLLLHAGADADLDKTDGDGRSPLHWAAQGNHKVVVQLLVDWGAVPNRVDEWENPTLYALENEPNGPKCVTVVENMNSIE